MSRRTGSHPSRRKLSPSGKRIIEELAAYVILAINCGGRKEVLSIETGENESTKYWLGVFNSLKNRGLQDILILCADGLAGSMTPLQRLFLRPNFSVALFIRLEIP